MAGPAVNAQVRADGQGAFAHADQRQCARAGRGLQPTAVIADPELQLQYVALQAQGHGRSGTEEERGH